MSNNEETKISRYAQRKEKNDLYRSKVLRFTFQLSIHDSEVREWFERQPDKGAYLKRLILDDKERQLEGLQERPISFDPLTADDCTPIDFSQEVRGKIAAVKLESLLPANRTADHQLVLVNGVVYGNTCSCVNLYSGKRVRWKPNEIIGEVKPECLPNWAKDRYSVIEQEKAMKESRDMDGR